MSRGVSTAARYGADNGPVVFGTKGLDVRWNRLTSTIVLEATDGSGGRWSATGETAELLIVALAAAHTQGRLMDAVCAVLDSVRVALATHDHWYRVGRLMCWRPVSQERAP